MYAILGENNSDVDMLFNLVRRIAKNPTLKIKRMGFDGCGELLRRGARQLRAYNKLGFTRFIICYDSDKDDPSNRYKEIVKKIILESGVKGEFCALVPIQEIESWILADLEAVKAVIPTWRIEKNYPSPELNKSPKEELERMSRAHNLKPLYIHNVHNPSIAIHLNLEIVVNKCSSSFPLFEFIQSGVGNHPLPDYISDAERRKSILEILQN